MSTKHAIDGFLTQELSDMGIRPLTVEQHGYLRSVFQHRDHTSGWYGNRSTDARLHAALVKKGLLVDGSFRKLTDLGERTCCTLFPELTPEGRAARLRENNERAYSEAVRNYQYQITRWHQRRLALAEEFSTVALTHGTDLGFGLPLRLADVIVGAQPIAPNPSDYGIEVAA